MVWDKIQIWMERLKPLHPESVNQLFLGAFALRFLLTACQEWGRWSVMAAQEAELPVHYHNRVAPSGDKQSGENCTSRGRCDVTRYSGRQDTTGPPFDFSASTKVNVAHWFVRNEQQVKSCLQLLIPFSPTVSVQPFKTGTPSCFSHRMAQLFP